MKVAIIGAGISGILAIKACKEESSISEIVCFERTRFFGGIWKYRGNEQSENSVDGEITTVMRSTVANSSKEMSSFSDYPPPEDAPNYMHNTQMFEYIENYVKHFDCSRHIKFSHLVIKIKKVDEKWQVTYKALHRCEANNLVTEMFDGVMVCVGHHTYPHFPSISGIQTFKGSKLHSQQYKQLSLDYQDKKVLIIGSGNSALDIAVELSDICKKVYLSTRSGCWVLPRLGFRGGRPNDLTMLRRYLHLLKMYIPTIIQQIVIETMYNKRFDHELFGLRPNHPLFHEHPTVNDIIPSKLMCGTVILKANVERFTENSVYFQNDSNAYAIDAAIFATGFQLEFPFLESELQESILDRQNNSVKLYKYVFPVDENLETLGFIGLPNAVGPLFPIAELQCRWYVQTLIGNCELPSIKERLKAIEEETINRKRNFTQRFRHGTKVEWIPYLDELAEQINAKPNLKKLIIEDPKLWFKLMLGPSLPYQYRLQGPHAWSEARAAIFSVNQRVEKPFEIQYIKYEKQALYVPKMSEINVLLRITFGLFVVMIFEAIYMFTK